MNEQQQRISEDLAGLFEGELRFDQVAREIYSTDASIYQIRPLGVAYPRHRDDVVTLAQYARDCDLPLIARGAGSGVAGGALGRGLIVDFSRHLNRVEEIGEQTVRVQAGVVRDQLNAALQPMGRYFAPDPSNTATTTVGGMLAVDAAGSHAVRVGSTRDHVQSIELVLADGTSFEAGTLTRADESPHQPRRNELVSQVAHLLKQQQDLIAERQSRLIRNASGYHLRTVLEEDSVNLPRLLVGSEGTLALFTAATLHTSALPAHRGAVLLLFGDLLKAIECVNAIGALQPSACDLLDKRLLSLARDADERFAVLLPANVEAAVLVEQTGYSDRQMRGRLQDILTAVKEVDSHVLVAQQATCDEDVEFLWSLPYRVVTLLNRLGGEARPVPLVEDIAVPPAVLHDFLVKAQRVFQRHWITASLYAHAASGQVHFRPFLRPPSDETANLIETLSRELYEVAIACGGTVSGEHGNGLSRTAFIRSQYGPLYRVFQQIKEIFDPHNLLNPGKIISDDPHLTIRDLRTVPAEPNRLVPLQFQWEPGELNDTIQRCNGCGDCRTQSATARMCPFFREEQREDASPRSKANLLRGLLCSTVDSKSFSTDEAKALADLCFNCKQCELECPSNVNIPALAIETKAQCVAASGLSRADWTLSRAHSFGDLGCRFPAISNWALGNRRMRWLIEKLFGISRLRRLPRFTRTPFLEAIRKHRSPASDRRVVFFVDHFANYHDPELGHALVKILEHHGVEVIIPQDQMVSGMAMISAGDLEAARAVARSNVLLLAEYAREGIPIVCTEPTAAVCLQEEYPRLLDHPDVKSVAQQAIEAGMYLRQLHEAGKLDLRFQSLPMKVGYHTPCHLRYLTPEPPLASLLSMIPALQLIPIEKGCSAMAGAYGLSVQNFPASVSMGAGLISAMQEPDFLIGITECSSCKLQMDQKATVPTLHPLKLLALAYGLLPDIRERLTNMPKKELLAT